VLDWRGATPLFVKAIGRQGNAPGELQYPYGIALTKDSSILVSEFGNHRVQKLDLDGNQIASWGSPGNQPGQLNQPWATATDSRNRVYVVDSGNNRVQRFRI
jgi:DNA-binding beta-propeller fold protein YncE